VSKIRHKIIADFLVIIHLLWIILLVGGTVFVFYNRLYIPYHLTFIGGTAFINLLFKGCPLTWLEKKYRKAWDPAVPYDHSFMTTYAEKLFGIDADSGWVFRVQVLAKVVSFTLSILLLTKVL
jgi:hypothetical protein